jgi:hypothetical protein
MKKGYPMSRRSKLEFFRSIYEKYHQATSESKSMLLDEACRVCGYNRKYAIRKLNQPRPRAKAKSSRPPRPVLYEARTIAVLREIWEAAGYPWSVRLYALLRLWQPWVQRKFHLTQDQFKQ